MAIVMHPDISIEALTVKISANPPAAKTTIMENTFDKVDCMVKIFPLLFEAVLLCINELYYNVKMELLFRQTTFCFCNSSKYFF